ncbi:hypothetical protein MKY34_12165 [Sporosarcina sp. FSL K6-1522]|uniref:hypothetical protein n=1 Tax=Sporosarcina sp. FSL K6-1522 TaxID=2921554 RepID=UPI00315A6DDE
MGNVPKTISFRTDEITTQKMEKIRQLVFEGRDVSNALILRTAIDFLHDNYGKGISATEDILEIVEAYIKVAYLSRPQVDLKGLGDFLGEVKEVYDEQYPVETLEIAKLYDDENPITVAQLIRFSNRMLPETFLRIMEVDEVEYVDLPDDELADFLLKKFSEDSFREKAQTLFKMIF